MLNLYQESYFLYNRSNIAKQCFVNELNQFLPIYCSADLFGEKKTKKYKERAARPADRNISREKADTTDKKVHQILISQLGRKRRKQMSVLDFIIIRRQQRFDEEKAINPIEIRVENNRIQNMFDKYARNKAQFPLEGILFSSSIKNETEKIFLQTTGLTDAKYGLINDGFKQVIGVINLNQTENWNEIKKSSQWVNVNFQPQRNNKNARHFPYNFITNNKDDLLNFKLKLVDTDNKLIEFAQGEKKFPILNFMIEF